MFITNVVTKINNQRHKPKFLNTISIGDIVEVQVLIKEGNKERIQRYEGTIISIKLKSILTIRRIFQGVGIEYVFSIFTPNIISLSVKKHSKVRRSKLYFLRNRIGKKAQLKNKISNIEI